MVAAIAAVLTTQTHAYVLTPYKWATSKVTMHMQLGSTPRILIDRAGTYNKAGAPGVTIWNPFMRNMQFAVAQNSTAAKKSGNKINNVMFASTIFGSAFGSSTLAVCLTTYYTASKTAIESDIVLNTKYRYDSYRGSLRSGTYDLKRVLVHEVGHAAGLGHTNRSNNIMLPVISNRETPGSDDIAGIQKLYLKR